MVHRDPVGFASVCGTYRGYCPSDSAGRGVLENRMRLPTPMPLSIWTLAAVLLGLSSASALAQSQDHIYRCGNEYTNSPSQAQLKGCVALSGGNVTVVQGTKQTPKAAPVAKPAPNGANPPSQSQVDPAQQKSRDSDARTILSHELTRAEGQLAEVVRIYNGGKPVARSDELQNTALYAQRVADLKASVARAEADVAGIRRELQRLGGATGPVPVGSPPSAVVAR